MTELSKEAQAIVDAGRSALTPSSVTKLEVLAQVETKAALAPSGGESLIGQTAGAAGPLKLLVVMALIAGAGAGWWLLRGDSGAGKSEVASAEQEAALAPAEQAEITEGLPATSLEALPAPDLRMEDQANLEAVPEAVPEAAAKPEAPRLARRPRKSAADTLLAERKLIAAAQRSIRDGEFARARKLLKQHKSEFPTGVLVPEHDAADAIALCLSGAQAKGTRAAERFLRKYDKSPLAARVRKSCL